MRRVEKLRALFIFLSLFWTVGCSTGRLLPKPVFNGRMGFFDRLSDHEKKILNENHPQQSRLYFTEEMNAIQKELSHFSWPLRLVHVTSPFGRRGHVFHEGVDLRARTGTPVYAAESGVVLYANKRIRGYGKMVVIRHLGGIATVYAHNSKLLVKRGQRVKQGEQITVSGCTGRSRGPHLHFEIRRGMAAINPLNYLPKLDRGFANRSPSRTVASVDRLK